jgi:hypothetical protein
MHRDDLNSRSQVLPLGTNRRALRTFWHLAWFVALALIGMVAGVYAVAGDPDWRGTDPEEVSDSLTNRAWQSAIAAGPPQRIVVAWTDQESVGAPRNVYVRRSDDNARTWSAPEVISTTVYQSALPDVCGTGNQAFVAWVDQLTIGGQNVAVYEAEVGVAGTREIPSPIPLSSTRPRLAAGPDRLDAVFSAGVQVLYASRPLAATTWPTATRIYTSTTALSVWFPVLAIGPGGDALHVVWQEDDFVTGESAIMYVRGVMNDSTVQWGPARKLSSAETSELFYPTIAADSAGNLHVAWGEASGTGGLEQRDQYVHYTRYDVDSGEWISPAIRIDLDPVRVNQYNPTYTAPSLALFEKSGKTEVCVAWHGFRAGGVGENVLLSCSLNQGQSWSLPENMSRNADIEAMSLAPAIAFDAAGQLHGVWQGHKAYMGDSVIYNYQVYHSRALYRFFMPFAGSN